jgi:4-amino-4-deoxy-L-arabinose transferase-like glycosyltransferase
MDIFVPIIEILAIGIPLLLLLTAGEPPMEREFLRRVVFIGFALRLGLSILFATIPETRVFHEDSNGYEGTGMFIASSWMGQAPPINLGQRLDFQVGGYPGFVLFCGCLYYCFGRFPIVVTAFTSLFGAISIVFIYRLGIEIFHRIVARRAVLLIAYFPSMILWSSMALKDPVLIMLLLIGLQVTMALRRDFRLSSVLALVAICCAIWLIRFYIVYFFLAGIGSSFILFHGSRRVGAVGRQVVVAILIIGTLGAVGLTGEFSNGFERLSLENAYAFRRAMASTARSGFGHDADTSTMGGALSFLPVGISVLLLSPFPWQMTSFRSILTLPEMLFWWSCIPATVRGLRFALKRELASTGPIVVFATTLCVAYSLSLGNVGAAFRQRSQILVFLFIFAALGHYLKRCRRAGIDPDLLRARQ